MAVMVPSRARQALPRFLSLLLGDTVTGRLRSGTLAILGLAVAVVLTLTGLALQHEAPPVAGGPAPWSSGQGGGTERAIPRSDGPGDPGSVLDPQGLPPSGAVPQAAAAPADDKAGEAPSKRPPGRAPGSPAAAPGAFDQAPEPASPERAAERAPREVPAASAPTTATAQPPASASPQALRTRRPQAEPVSTSGSRGHGRGGRPASASPPPGHARAAAASPGGPAAAAAPAAHAGPPGHAAPGHASPPGNAHGHRK